MITKGFGDGTLLTKGLGGLLDDIREIVRFVSRITTEVLWKRSFSRRNCPKK